MMMKPVNPWIPKSFIALQHYNVSTFLQDLISGITVGLVALPLAMAFAISSGMSPQAGIYCAIVTGFLVSLLGGSKVQIGGPTGAFVVVVSGIIAKHGIDGLFMCTMMAGVLLVLLGVTGLGTAVKYIPRPVVVGFTNGIAVLIASTQIKDFFGLQVEKVPSEFFAKIEVLLSHGSTLSYETLGLSLCSLLAIILVVKYVKRIPGYIVALISGTLYVTLTHSAVATVGTKFGGIPSGLPSIAIPQFQIHMISGLLLPAVTVAMLGAIESLMSAVVADRMSGDRHNPNVELVAQGIANIASPLFGGLPATGAIARTATNIRSGAKTPVSGMIHSITLLLIILFAAPLVKNVPLASLAAILFVVSYNMGEWSEIPEILKSPRADRVVWIVTFGLTVFADLTVAVTVGMILAALLYIEKVTSTTTVSEVTPEYVDDGRVHILQDKPIPTFVSLYRIHGPFLFGATDKLTDLISDISTMKPVVLLRLRNMTAIDATGIQAIEEFAKKVHGSGRALVLCGASGQPLRAIQKADFESVLGKENICLNISSAIERAEVLFEELSTIEIGDESKK